MAITIKQIRQLHGLSQEKLAEMLKTTPEIIESWETGKSSIPNSSIKDLAIIFNRSVDDILGLTEEGRTNYPEVFAKIFEEKTGQRTVGQYGGVTLTLKGVKHPKDYPIDTDYAEEIVKLLPNLDKENYFRTWLSIETMNNYILFMNLKTLKIAYLYSDAKEPSPPFYHPEIYRVLTNWDNGDFDISETLTETVKSIVKKFEEDNKHWDSFEEFHYIKIYWLDGTETSHYLDEQLYSDLSWLRSTFDLVEEFPNYEARFIREEDKGGSVTFLNLDHISLIEIPAIRFWEKFWEIDCEEEPEMLENRNLSPYLPLLEKLTK